MRVINHKPHFAVIALGLLSCLGLASSGCKAKRTPTPKPFVVQQDDIIIMGSSADAVRDALNALELGDVEPEKRQAIECEKGKTTISASVPGVDLSPSVKGLEGQGYSCVVVLD